MEAARLLDDQAQAGYRRCARHARLRSSGPVAAGRLTPAELIEIADTLEATGRFEARLGVAEPTSPPCARSSTPRRSWPSASAAASTSAASCSTLPRRSWRPSGSAFERRRTGFASG